MSRAEQIQDLQDGGLSLNEAIELTDRLQGITAHQNAVDKLNKIDSKKLLSTVVKNHTQEFPWDGF